MTPARPSRRSLRPALFDNRARLRAVPASANIPKGRSPQPLLSLRSQHIRRPNEYALALVLASAFTSSCCMERARPAASAPDAIYRHRRAAGPRLTSTRAAIVYHHPYRSPPPALSNFGGEIRLSADGAALDA